MEVFDEKEKGGISFLVEERPGDADMPAMFVEPKSLQNVPKCQQLASKASKKRSTDSSTSGNADLEYAMKLQASFDREHDVLSSLERNRNNKKLKFSGVSSKSEGIRGIQSFFKVKK